MSDLRFCGHTLEPAELALIVELATRYGRLSRHELAQTVCELLGWQRPNGQPKTIECRALLERMQEAGLIGLPALKSGRPRGAGSSVPVSPDPESAPLDAPLATLQPIRLQRVATPGERTLWRTLIERHHYLGHRVPFGAHLRYLIQTMPIRLTPKATMGSVLAWPSLFRQLCWNFSACSLMRRVCVPVQPALLPHDGVRLGSRHRHACGRANLRCAVRRKLASFGYLGQNVATTGSALGRQPDRHAPLHTPHTLARCRPDPPRAAYRPPIGAYNPASV